MNTLNPFIVKGEIPEKYFCDRVAESKTLIDHILNGRNVVLTSPRRVGKTGLIYHCYRYERIDKSYYSFFVDILQTSSLREFTYALGQQIFETLKPKSKKMLDLFLRTVKSISGEFGYDPITNMPNFKLSLGAISNPEYTLDEIFQYIALADKRCVIAIDEFQQITRYPEKNVEAILRTHIQHCSNADFIFAGSERHVISEMFNSYSRPFYASTAAMSLEPIRQDVYTDFVLRLFNEFEKSIDPEVVVKVYRLFEGNTYCMQRTFNVAFSYTEHNTDCSAEIVETAIKDILQEHEHFYQMQMSLISPKVKDLLYAIAIDRNAHHLTSGDFVRRHHLASPSSVQSALKQLLADDWVTFNTNVNGTKVFKLTDPFLMLWIQKYYGDGGLI